MNPHQLNIEGRDPIPASEVIMIEGVVNVRFFAVLRKAFDGFDHNRSGSIPCDFVADILRMMGQPFNKKILEELIEEVDADSKYSTK